MRYLIASMIALAQFADPKSLPEGYLPFGSDITLNQNIPGWVNAPDASFEHCSDSEKRYEILAPLAQPVRPQDREETIRRLEHVWILPLTERDVLRYTGTTAKDILAKGRLAGSSHVADDEHAAKVGSDKWPPDDPKSYKPYLVRSAARRTPVHTGHDIDAGLCGDELIVETLLFYNAIPPASKWPAIVFLPRRPNRLISIAQIAY
jgi:hypothetical protein